MSHTHFRLHIALTSTTGRSSKPSKQACPFENRRALDRRTFHCFSLSLSVRCSKIVYTFSVVYQTEQTASRRSLSNHPLRSKAVTTGAQIHITRDSIQSRRNTAICRSRGQHLVIDLHDLAGSGANNNIRPYS